MVTQDISIFKTVYSRAYSNTNKTSTKGEGKKKIELRKPYRYFNERGHTSPN